MPARKLPWHKLGQPAGWAGTLPSLLDYFGASWPAISLYFRPTQHLALSIDCPKPGGDGCPRQIVEHGFNDLVAVCGNSPSECAPIPVLRKDLIIHELKIDPLLAGLARLLHIQGAAPERIPPLTWNLGSYSASGRPARSVFLCLEDDACELRLVIMTLLNQQESSFMLLIPSRQPCPPSLLLLLQKHRVPLVALDEPATGLEGADTAHLLVPHPGEAPNECLEHENSFRRENDFWHIRFQGRSHSFKDSVGVTYIAHLIQRAYNDEPEIHAADLYYMIQGRPPVTRTALDRLHSGELEELGLDITGVGDGLDLMTPEGKEWARRQVKQLEQQIEESEEVGNLDEAYHLRANKEALVEYIAKAYGLSGRGRKVADPAKRVRQAVSKAIGKALAHIKKKGGDELAVYLKTHCKLGSVCSFRKDPSIRWQIMQKKN